MYGTPINHNETTYRHPLRQWDQLATVRAQPHRILSDDEAMGKVYFPPALVPIAQHPIVINLGPAVNREILILRLYQYLDFTRILEQQAVNPGLLQIAHQRIGVALPNEMVFDAHKIYVDEGYHAFSAIDLKQQVEAGTGVLSNPVGIPNFLRHLREIELTVPVELRQMSSVFFTIVSETLISVLLSKIPRDREVVGAVREVVADHAVDEGRHHTYFATLLDFLWPQLTPRHKGIIGPLLPQFILAFLKPDYSVIERVLARYSLKYQEIQLVIEESYPEAVVISDAREGAKATLHHFERNGILAEPRTAEAFHSSGLIPVPQFSSSELLNKWVFSGSADQE